ncbi:MAG: carboxylating nicotinate-nucleotide diphosphorylase [Candidatus Aureabacteria bacterium]|nr:carboxylating nicotinate-nucleotide diphosphorylase [Candidatus Auribacterota bacterium]
MDLKKLDRILKLSLREDIERGDITTDSIVGPHEHVDFVISLKEDAVICGIPVVKHIFQLLDANLKIDFCAGEGDFLSSGSLILKARGKGRAVLTGERTALNFCQRLSGIATQARKYVEAVKGTGVLILDTRKTLPRFRYVEKYAVRVGGAANHRFGLFDEILIKENHLKVEEKRGPEFIRRAVEKTRERYPGKKIEIEVSTLKEAGEALNAGADIILLDNMSVTQVKKAMVFLKGKVEVEVSGGIRLKNVRHFAKTGVNYISIGALTHSVKAIDMTLMVL